MPLQIPAIKEESAPSKEQAHVFHQLLGAIEAVRLKRQEDYRDHVEAFYATGTQ